MSKMYKKWTQEEVDFLSENIDKLSYREIANALDKTTKAVSNKAFSMNLKKVSPYTEEDEEFLMKYYGRASMKKLCKRIRKSERSIKHRMRMLEGTENVYIINGYYKTTDVAAITGVDNWTVVRWIQRGDLSGIRPNKLHYINPDAFWKFIKNNLHKCTVRNIDDQVLLTCPEWYQSAINERKKNYHAQPQRMKNWTTKEVALLNHYIFKGYSYNKIASELNRSYHSIKNKVNYLEQQKQQ